MANGYTQYCEEHNVPLYQDGSCPFCFDSEGKRFPLDMQSTYLLKDGFPIPKPTPKGNDSNE
jgi:hypothetical protein